MITTFFSLGFTYMLRCIYIAVFSDFVIMYLSVYYYEVILTI